MTPEQIRTAACEAYDIAARGCIADEKHATGVEAVFRAGMAAGRAEAPEMPDDGELEAWRATADDLLRCASDNADLTRRAAHLLRNAYMFGRKLQESK